MIDGQIPDDKQLIPEQVDQNSGELARNGDHAPHDPSGSHWKTPSGDLVAWSTIVTAGVGILTLALTVVLVLLALR